MSAVDSLLMTSGERFDFVLNADQMASSFWIRFRGNMDWNSKNVFQTAILRYENSPDVEPDEIVTYESTSRNGTVKRNKLKFYFDIQYRLVFSRF